MSSFSILLSALSVSYPAQDDKNNMAVSNSRIQTILLFVYKLIQHKDFQTTKIIITQLRGQLHPPFSYPCRRTNTGLIVSQATKQQLKYILPIHSDKVFRHYLL